MNAVAATCTADGYTGDTYCTDCGEKIASGSTIHHVEYSYNDDATCTENGTKTGNCTRCEYTETIEALDTALGHNVEYTYNNDATCTKNGTNTGKCTNCEYTETVEAPDTTLAHTEEIIPRVIPTCTNTGLTEGKKCTVCDEITVPQSVIKAHGHVDEDTDGYCDICDELYPEGSEQESINCIDFDDNGYCDICGKQLRLHTFTCPLCEKAYTNWLSNSVLLAIHSVVHIIYALISIFGVIG